ncbi:BMP family ABC transporter substrate-binding protein [Agrobacterium vitis]|uniref:BMP family ABC transporter substrate-binding protein n=1 Tax=Agrobacterium vitis TaxID=373 RepID=UPI0012E8899A|nr:BMP family ABC transporter substrate-binding protein [Agrobacterium vitis]MVA26292.1 BMP family ABC transporter substrate-binding protein [Agrobacterium vitis]NSZ16742.1 BMP family ABC transporter substrate-binding protein [Agrobacterium vitis]QZO05494.1 BMP family ABC transporter substrate-binding protein [Agrobacterium vitis]UJL87641.1 BMP family ABC transporter substrate-binding protein [Agrobacterium vitis]
MKKLALAFAASVATMLSVAGSASAADKTKICFVYVGSKTDGGWTQAHELGRQELQKHFGDKIDTPFLENVPEGPDAERAIERLAREDCKLIFTTSFGFMDATVKVAKKFPKVKFEHATGFKSAENVATYNSRFYEGRYISGVIAGKMSKKGEAGYIASFPIPEVVMGINAFEQGAKSVNPNFKMKVIWVNTWFDPGKEADAAKALLDQGVDILTQHTDTTAPMQIAQERGIKAFGQASDMIAAGPTSQLTAIKDTWGAYYIKRTQALLDGKWTSEQSFDGLKDGILTMAPYTNMPDDVKKLAEDTEAKIKSGELHPFTGPVNKQDGTAWLKAGEKADDKTLLGMNFYVEGVDDKLPK